MPSGIIVAGMHRSSTSLVTSLIASSGYWMPDEQLPPRPDNPKGYFEDLRMHKLHLEMMWKHDSNWDNAQRWRQLRRKDLTVPPELEPEAEELVRLYDEHEPWVWKNPRATMWLEEWGRRFPDALVVVCLRRPDAVVDSMLRRHNRMRVPGKGLWVGIRRVWRGLSVWRSHNLVALRFARRHPERTIVIRIPEDLQALERGSGQKLFNPKMLRPPRSKIRIPARFSLTSWFLYWRLARLADADALLRILAANQERQASVRDDAGSATSAAVFAVAGSAAVAALVNAAAALAS